MRRACLLLTGMMVLCVVATFACAAENASEAAEKVSVDGPVTVPFQPAYRNQASEDADAKPSPRTQSPSRPLGRS